MVRTIVAFCALFFSAVALVPAAAHLSELPNKLHLDRDDYLTVQQVYRGWALFGGAVVAALASTVAFAWTLRGQRSLFRLALCAALFALLGQSPARGLALFFIEPFAGTRALGELSLKAAPLLLIGTGLALSFRANVWNIGAEGQFLMGAVAATGIALAFQSSGSALVLPAMIAAGALGGALWAAIPALLKTRFNANEILVSDLTRALAGVSGISFEDRGVHSLKGLDGEWRLHALLDGSAP